MDIDPLLKVNLNSEIGRFGIIVRVGGRAEQTIERVGRGARGVPYPNDAGMGSARQLPRCRVGPDLPLPALPPSPALPGWGMAGG